MKVRMAETEKREKEMQDRAGTVLSEAGKKKENADKKLAKANRLIAEYQTALVRETAQIKREMQIELQEKAVRDYVQRNFVDKGMCADWAIHDSENNKGKRNLHIHVLFTMRPLTENGEWGAKQKKIYDLDENGEKIPVIDKRTGQQKVDKREVIVNNL